MNFIGGLDITDIIFCALSAVLAIYGAVVVVFIAVLFFKGTGRDGRDSADAGDGVLPGVSIVIPFRNEELNLAALLESLARQDYRGMMEVILVDDQSDDDGVNTVKAFCQENDGIDIKIITLQPSQEIKLTSKQQALDLGVDTASYPLIAFTDADMILEPNWIKSLVDTHLSTQSALVFGHTAIINNKKGFLKRLFAHIESFQLSYLFSFAHIFAKLGLTGSCMGNNILVTKDAYQQCGGQRGVGYTIVEDRALLELMRKKKFKTCAAEPFAVTARTYPSESIKQFMNQMARWAAGGLRPGGGLFAAGLLLLAQNVIFLLAIPLTILLVIFLLVIPINILLLWVWGAIYRVTVTPIFLTAANFALTWIFIAISFAKNRSPAPKWLFPVHYLFMMAETVVFGVMLIFKPKIRWKGRKL